MNTQNTACENRISPEESRKRTHQWQSEENGRRTLRVIKPNPSTTGRINLGGTIATAGGLIFIGATNDNRVRAFDSRTGKELWSTKLDYSALSTPITFRGKNGKQYVAISAAGGMGITDPNPANSESIHVFALP